MVVLLEFMDTIFFLQPHEKNEFEVDPYNLKMSQLLSGSFESPIQVTLLLICWGRNKLDAPWNDPTVF